MELSGARQGVIERMPNRRVYTDFDLTFYIDSKYKTLRLFEEWMNYIDPLTNNDGAYAGDLQRDRLDLLIIIVTIDFHIQTIIRDLF